MSVKINDRCNILWVVQSRKKVRKGAKKKPWRILLIRPSHDSPFSAIFRERETARMVATGQAELHPDREFRPRRYTDSGKA